MSAVVLRALKEALVTENNKRAEARRAADRLSAESAAAQEMALDSESACVELKQAIDAMEAVA